MAKKNIIQKTKKYGEDIYKASSKDSAIAIIVAVLTTAYYTIRELGKNIGIWLSNHDKNRKNDDEVEHNG